MVVFPHLGFWSGNFFLIAPFPDHGLPVPFYILKQYTTDSMYERRRTICETLDSPEMQDAPQLLNEND